MVMLYIKLEGMKRMITCKQVCFPYTHPQLQARGKKKFLKVIMLHILYIIKVKVGHAYTKDGHLHYGWIGGGEGRWWGGFV